MQKVVNAGQEYVVWLGRLVAELPVIVLRRVHIRILAEQARFSSPRVILTGFYILFDRFKDAAHHVIAIELSRVVRV